MKEMTLQLDELISDPANARKHSPENLEAIEQSLRRFGPARSIVIDKDGIVRAGNGTLEAAKAAGIKSVRVVQASDEELVAVLRNDWSDSEAAGYAIADNRAAELAEWDDDVLRKTLASLKADTDADDILESLGFDDKALDDLLKENIEVTGHTRTPAEPKEPPPDPVTQPGDLWTLGDHRLLCDDSTNAVAVDRLLDGRRPRLVLADPPYGMGKEKDGIAGDNQYGDRLDAFQMLWWNAVRSHLLDNASAYIWGNPEPLWRLWLNHLAPSEELTFRNEIVWDKGSGFGQNSHEMRSYSVNTERCLFFMLGRQYFGNVNKDDFFEGYEPIRAYLAEQVEKMEWTPGDVNKITGVGMYGHWFTRSQWHLISEKHYNTLRDIADGRAFPLTYAELKDMQLEARDGGEHLDKVRSFNALRSFFDNTHDNMNEVWTAPRVQNEDRFGHATPKPVELAERIVLSSCPEGDLVYDPFVGTGPSIIAAELHDRRCYGLEIHPAYCDIVLARWAETTGLDPVRQDGEKFKNLSPAPTS